MYLGSNVVTNHAGKSQHQHFHAVTSHLGTLLAINVNVVEVGSILGRQGDLKIICHHSTEAVCQSFPHYLQPCSCYKRLFFAVDKVSTQQNLGITVQHHRHNVVPKQAQIACKGRIDQ
jgi:hypothetical protein